MWLYRGDDIQSLEEFESLPVPEKFTSNPDYSNDEPAAPERLRRFVGGEMSLNVSLLHHMNTGSWYMAFYNDALAQTQVRKK